MPMILELMLGGALALLLLLYLVVVLVTPRRFWPHDDHDADHVLKPHG
jgi:hypothetical protein